MKQYKFISLSVLCALLSVNFSADAAVTISNASRSNAGAYQQIAAMQYQAEQSAAAATNPSDSLPVRVANKDIAARILAGDYDKADVASLDACAAIYPNGEFAWDTPTAGLKVGGTSTCVSVVKMYAMRQNSGTADLSQANQGDILLATANIAAGDSVNCNISEFPEYGYTIEAGNIVFPADAAPTIDDVKNTMNDEQKKNAGFKIAAGAILGGVGGHLLSDKDVTTGKKDFGGAAIGALSGSALMAGSSFGGKVGGDMILSAGVNAAAGGVVGNMVASGKSVLRIEDCKDLTGKNTTCLWGVLEKSTKLTDGTCYYNIDTGKIAVCDTNSEKCNEKRMIGFTFPNSADASKPLYTSVEEGLADQNFLKVRQDVTLYKYMDEKTKNMNSPQNAGGIWVSVDGCGEPGDRIAAMIPDVKDKAFGLKMTDWYELRNQDINREIYTRNARGEAGALTADADGAVPWTLNDFYPLTVDAGDGGIIDINNKARLSGTLIGAGAGAGLGAFTAYQGATDEIDARWVSAVTEYKDSLQKIYCMTGKRFLTSYNDLVVIPNIPQQ